MPLQTDAKIRAGMAAYLELCKDAAPDDSKIMAFTSGLKDELGWSHAEIIELQRRVIGKLLDHK